MSHASTGGFVMTITCPECAKTFTLPFAVAGTNTRCPACKARVPVTDADDLEEPEPEEPQPKESQPDTYATEAAAPRKEDSPRPTDKADAGSYGLDEGDEIERKSRKKRQRREDFDGDEDGKSLYRRPPKNVQPHRGILILVLGILSIMTSGCALLCWILAGIALNMASNDGPQMERGLMDRNGQGLTTAGQMCAYVGILLGLGGCVFNLYVATAPLR
jgi:uncharacterized Zn finger protein (UPF0148 family)